MKKFTTLSLILFIYCSCQQKASQAYIKQLDQHRKEYKIHFKENERSPLKQDEELAMMDFFPADESYVCKCQVSQDDSANLYEMSTYANKKKKYKIFGIAHCNSNGRSFNLTLYQYMMDMNGQMLSKQLFLPFKDHTNGESTYGGGRYMDLSTDDVVGGEVTLDFNKAYNPWCAYSDGYNCPIPPPVNHLDFALKAGEKNYKGEVKKAQ